MAGKPYETNRGNDQDDDASGCDPAEDVKSLQPRIDGVAQKHDVFQVEATIKTTMPAVVAQPKM